MSVLINQEAMLLLSLASLIFIWAILAVSYIRLVKQSFEQEQQLRFDRTYVVPADNSHKLNLRHFVTGFLMRL